LVSEPIFHKQARAIGVGGDEHIAVQAERYTLDSVTVRLVQDGGSRREQPGRTESRVQTQDHPPLKTTATVENYWFWPSRGQDYRNRGTASRYANRTTRWLCSSPIICSGPPRAIWIAQDADPPIMASAGPGTAQLHPAAAGYHSEVAGSRWRWPW